MKHPKVGSALDGLIARVQAGEISAEDAAREAPIHRGDSIGVAIHLSGNSEDVVRFLEANGASNITAWDDYIEAFVPILLLAETSDRPGVIRVRPIQPPGETQSGSSVSGNGPTVHGSTAWNQAGYSGTGIKVGVIDGGFDGFANLMGTELPASVQARCYESLGEFSDDLKDCEGSTHGTAVAESVIDIAPDVSLYIADPDSPGELRDTVDWMISEGVSVINHSRTWLFDGPGDGTSPYPISPLNTVDRAVAAGIVWVNAAGNSAQLTWFQRGPFSYTTISVDGEDVRVINFSGSNFRNRFHVWGSLQLRWDDAWDGAASDLDLYLVTPGGGDIVLASIDPQSGNDGHDPYERVVAFARYDVVIAHSGGSEPGWIQLLGWQGEGLTYGTPESGSITSPAESANPGMMTVGAAHWQDVSSIESYSSRGPTPGGDIKPDLVGADCGDTAARSTAFCGTSQASPHVAGMAALVRQRFPNYSPAQVVSYLEENAEQRINSPDPNNTWGHGFVVLPTPSAQAISPPSVQTVTSGASSLTVEWSAPSSDGGSTITAYDLRHIPTSADETADANWTVVQDAWTGAGGLSYEVTGLSTGTQYDVQVRAVNSAGDGPWSATFAGTTTIVPPGAPTGLAATSNGQTQIDLSWTAPSADGGSAITGYRVEVSRDGSAWSDLVGDTRSTATSYVHTGLPPGATRHYRVSAINSAGTGDASNVANAATGIPAAPDLVVVTLTVTASAPAASERFTFSATVRNQGNGPSDSTTLRYYASTDSTITTGDTEIDTDSVARLDALETGDESVSLVAPDSPGTYYLGACVDAVTGESDTTNNCSIAVVITVGAAPAPDLVVDTPTVDTSAPVAGARFTLSATVRNQGNGRSDSTTLRYYESTDSTITTGDTEIDTDYVSRLDASGSGDESVRLIAPTDPGTYYLGACVDAVTGESDTTNNCSVGVLVTVGAAPAPDLVVDTPTVNNNNPAAGARIVLSAAVRNQGGGRSDSTTLRYYQSSDATITANDTEVGTDSVSGIRASASGRESISLVAPSTPGTYYYGACVVAVTGESNTANNCSAAVTVTIGSAPATTTAPDLVVDTPTVSDGNPAAGARITLSATVRNQGSGRSDSTTLRYYLSTDSTITTGDTEIDTDSVSRLDASGSSGESISLTAPSTSGTYYYGACVDTVTGESDTTNNCSVAVTVTIGAAPAPDLIVDTPSVSNSAPAAGISFTLNATVRNQGSGRSDTTTLRYYQSTDSTITADDTEVGTDSVSSLNASGSGDESVRLTAPSTSGTYYYGACVDAVTGESDTTNNCSSAVAVTVGAAPGPDLVVDTITVSNSAPAPGASIILNATVRNQGSASSPTTTIRYYLSSDSTISSSDTEIGTVAVVLLGAGGGFVTNVRPTAPSTAGTYYYGACVDAVSNESDTANNCSTSLTVTVEAPADQTGNRPPRLTGDVDDMTVNLGASFTVDISGLFTDPEGDDITDYGFTFRTFGILEGIVHTRTGILSLRAIAVGETIVAVDASDSHGLSGNSEDLFKVTVVSAKTANKPGAPTGLSATADGQTEIDLSWTAPSNNGGAAITGYKIEVSTDNSSWSVLVADTSSTAVTYSHTGLAAGSTRYYRVSAINSVGTGAASSVANATTDSASTPAADPPTKAVTGEITECSLERVSQFAELYEVTITGTLTAHRTVTNVRIIAYVDDTVLTADSIGTMSAGQTETFSFTKTILVSEGICEIEVSWLESS